ncbi:MAG TPA: DUF1236 domain-containing protein [Pseudolabrys sp.]|nr:DUF1236 domain-containing protein [Pseudolabrys sp.]
MRTILQVAAISVGVVAGAGVAVAAGQVNLSSSQKQTIKQAVSSASAQNAPSNFQAMAGAKVPSSLSLKALPSKVTKKIPSLKGDEFAKLKNNDIVIVSPSTHKVVASIKQTSTTGSSVSGTMTKGGGGHMSHMNGGNSAK